jgi:hypothetical protein
MGELRLRKQESSGQPFFWRPVASGLATYLGIPDEFEMIAFSAQTPNDLRGRFVSRTVYRSVWDIAV